MILDDYLMNEVPNENDILDLVDSKIPNIYFISPLLNLDNELFQERRNYDLFAKIIILRGEERIADIYNMLFFWLKDFNLPGSLQIRDFLIHTEKPTFMKGIYGALILAHDDDNEEWMSNLLSTLSERDDGPIGDLCEYMIDAEDYTTDYNQLIELIEKDLDIKEYE